ncbi:hypothetical protein [Nonomuraea gerenzanensis]|uniref:Uncharacterized protein n=1 Tax=Nonomuraea gerenzanensis TaxID=93944 RepID=A0A1M4BL06_9ACTN|nr:hypothetical protein [Nonomuraea gerenzanensis]UBU19186.1 hypothetical protein LCN96_56300 [Nonomuraea gerenzanensis]SAP16365.1 hypothetical protein BN4615_P11028 [Nonomuraea gerenzanensis]
MSVTSPLPGSFDDDIGRVLTAIEARLLLDQAPPVPAPPLRQRVADEEPVELETVTAAAVEADVDQNVEPEDVDQGDDIVEGELMPLDDDDAVGETQLVRRLRREVSEARRLVDLQADEAPLLVESKKVRRRRLAVIEAARLHELALDPVALAYRDARVRRVTTLMVAIGVVIGLAVSSVGVQASVATALILEKFSAAWWAAFLYEPAMSMPLLGTVAVQAYSAMRGKVVDRRSPVGRKMFRVEALLLTLTLILNCAPAFAPSVTFSLLTVLVHSLGPIVAVTSVWVLPALWSVLEVLPVPEARTGRTGGCTAHQYRANAVRQYSAPPARQRVDIDALTAQARDLIDAGRLSPDAGVHKFREALGCGAEPASKVKKAIAAAQAGGAA